MKIIHDARESFPLSNHNRLICQLSLVLMFLQFSEIDQVDDRYSVRVCEGASDAVMTGNYSAGDGIWTHCLATVNYGRQRKKLPSYLKLLSRQLFYIPKK